MNELVDRVEEFLGELPRATKDDRDVVYVIQALDGGPVKIGHTTFDAVDRRRQDLQTGNPRQLVIRALFSGGLWLEQALHEYFHESRLVGEWFSLSPQLIVLCPEVDLGG
jgi:hypothetical protein